MSVPAPPPDQRTHPDLASLIRRPTRRYLDRVLLQLGVALALLVVASCAVLVGAPGAPTWILLLFPATGTVYAAAGLVAWRRRPSNRLGAIMVVGGATWLVASWYNAPIPGLSAMGAAVAMLPIAVTLHLLLAFPTGRVVGRVPCWTVGALYGATLVLQAPAYLFDVHVVPPVLFVADRPTLVRVALQVQSWVGVAAIVVTTVVLVRRFRVASRSERLVLAPLMSYGIVALAFVSFAAKVAEPVLGLAPELRAALQLALLAGIPVAFAIGMGRGGFRRTGAVEELGAWLGAVGGGRTAVSEALRATLGDPSVEVVFWSPDQGRYVDAAGHEVELPADDRIRAVEEIELQGRRVGAVLYDARISEEPDLVRQAARVVALAVDRQRLTAEVLAGREALERSRARIVESADVERRRIARDLHDGLQMRLVVLALEADALGTGPTASSSVAREAAILRDGIDTAAAELRDLVHGLMPAALIERGLFAATEDLVDRVPIRTSLALTGHDRGLSPTVQSTAYFALAESLTNAVRHSAADRIAVRLVRGDGELRIEVVDNGVGGAEPAPGSGLHGLADRLDVLQGSLRVTSPPRDGTRIEVLLPCDF